MSDSKCISAWESHVKGNSCYDLDNMSQPEVDRSRFAFESGFRAGKTSRFTELTTIIADNITEISRLLKRVAEIEEWNMERAGQFACTEQRLACQIAKLQKDKERLDWLESYLSDNAKNIGQPSSRDPSWNFGYNGGMAYVIEGAGDTLRAAIEATMQSPPENAL